MALRVAENPSTPASTLERLSRCGSSELVDAVAQNPSTPPAVLVLLAGSRRWRTRLRVARRRDTPRNTLEHLAGSDPDLDVRTAAAMTLSAVLQPRPRAA